MVFEKLVAPIFNPLLAFDPIWIVLIISILVAVLITVIYKYTTNQSLMKDLKTELKELQKEMKTLRDDPKKMMGVQKQAMQTNMKYMGHSMRATLFTFIPIILIFGWMNAAVAFEPIFPGQEFSVTADFARGITGETSIVVPEGVTLLDGVTKNIVNGKARWSLSGEEGDYIGGNALLFTYNEETQYKDLIIASEQRYATPLQSVKKSSFKSINIDNRPMKILNLFGWKIGWLGTYIIFSIVFSMALRKWLKVY
jgi:uncharacterized membrane protein (DUF106 family)